MTLFAKPIVKNELWVITDGQNKIGNVQHTTEGYDLRIGNRSAHFDSTDKIEQLAKIVFQTPSKQCSEKQKLYSLWPVSGKTYNDVYDVKRKLHVYTKTKASKCYHVAGYFKINMNDEWQTIFCPKYIFIQRYPYRGPFFTQDQADSS
jgi:hypothetical protein